MNNFKELLKNITTIILDVDGVLTDGSVILSENGEVVRTMNVRDGYAMQLAVKMGIRIAVITGGKSQAVKTRLEGLGLHDIFLGSEYKKKAFDELCLTYHIKKEEILYMGDDMPDYEVMQLAGIATCPNDAAPEIKAISIYRSQFNGGKGCVRDIIEQVLKAQGKWT